MEVKGLKSKLGAAFILQAAVISLATILGVYAAAMVMEEILVKQTLRDEADYFYDKLSQVEDFPPPDTGNLTTYFRGASVSGTSMPDELAQLEPGFHDLANRPDELVYVNERDQGRAVFIFDKGRVGQLALFFGLIPLAGVLCAIYLSTWLLYRLSSRAVSPIIWLARHVEAIDPKQPDKEHFDDLDLEEMPGEPNGEVLALAEALQHFEQRHRAFVERERNFTRDASHELRSPLTVIKVAVEMLLCDELPAHQKQAAEKIFKASRDMEEMTQALLLLARESDQGLDRASVDVPTLVQEEIERIRPLVIDKPVSLKVDTRHSLQVQAARQVLSVMIGNLLRNACSYTDEGSVVVTIEEDALTVEDSGEGMPEDMINKVFDPCFRSCGAGRGGHGVGLTIVKRLSDRYGWPIDIKSELNRGTRVRVRFPKESRVVDHAA